MTRLVGTLVTLLLAWCGVVQPAQASVSTPMAAVAAYAYDGHHHHGAVLTYTTTERGPPASNDPGTTYDAVDRRPHGTSARQGRDAAIVYDDLAQLAQLAQLARSAGATATTQERAQVADVEFAVIDWTGVAAKTADEFVDLASAARRNHILYGDATGGGHLWPGLPGKTPFPKDWSAGRVMHEISDVATDPSSIFRTGRGGSTIVTGTRDGVDIRVILREGNIITGYPTNLLRNP